MELALRPHPRRLRDQTRPEEGRELRQLQLLRRLLVLVEEAVHEATDGRVVDRRGPGAPNECRRRGVGPGSDPGSHLRLDRKSTRLNSSHRCISYAVFCLKKKTRYEHNVKH